MKRTTDRKTTHEPTRTPRETVSHYLNNPRDDSPITVPKHLTTNADWLQVPATLREAVVDALVRQEWPLIMFGDPGAGKTCAMACVAKAWRCSSLWFDNGELLRRITSCRTSKTGSIATSHAGGSTVYETEKKILDKIEKVSLLCLDDVGVRTPTEAQREIFEHIIDLREGKPTILTTNLDHRKFADVFDMRLVSRVFCGMPLKVTGQDRRLANGNKIREV